MSNSKNLDKFQERLARLEGTSSTTGETNPVKLSQKRSSSSFKRKRPSALAWTAMIGLIAIGGSGAVYANLPKGTSEILEGASALSKMVLSDTFRADTLDVLMGADKTFNQPVPPKHGPEFASPFLLTHDTAMPDENTPKTQPLRVSDVVSDFVAVSHSTQIGVLELTSARTVCSVNQPSNEAQFVNVRTKSSSEFTPVNLSYRSQIADVLSKRVEKFQDHYEVFDDNFPMPKGMHPVDVLLTETGKPLYVVLQATGNQDILWNFQIAPDVVIEQIVIVGASSSGVANLPDGIPVEFIRSHEFPIPNKKSAAAKLEKIKEKNRRSHQMSERRKQRMSATMTSNLAKAPSGKSALNSGGIRLQKAPKVLDTQTAKVKSTAPTMSPRPSERGIQGIRDPKICTVSPWRKPQPYWSAWQKAKKKNTLYENQMRTFTKHYKAYQDWFQLAFGVDAQTNVLTAGAASHVLVGPLPTEPMPYKSLQGATVKVTEEHFAITGTLSERRAKNYEIHSNMLLAVTGGDLASLIAIPVSTEAAQ